MSLKTPVLSGALLALTIIGVTAIAMGLATVAPLAADEFIRAIDGVAVPPPPPTLVGLDASDIVSWSWGEWIANLLPLLGTVALSAGLAAWAVIRTFIPAPLRALADPIAERVIREAVDYALNAVDGATKGQKLDARVGNEVLRQALLRLEAQGDAVTKRLGGSAEMAKRIISRLDLVPEAKVVSGPDGRPVIARRAP